MYNYAPGTWSLQMLGKVSIKLSRKLSLTCNSCNNQVKLLSNYKPNTKENTKLGGLYNYTSET